MLAKIKSFFTAELDSRSDRDPQQKLQLAAAALLIELSRADYQEDAVEQQAIEAALQKSFKLEPEQLATLIELAEQESREATSLFQFTGLIRDSYSPEQRFELIKMLWQVAVVDGEISKYEDHMIRKIAGLIYLPHSQFIKAKLEAMAAMES
jgi:uncharacterized tellurite resistance protein B-like protein